MVRFVFRQSEKQYDSLNDWEAVINMELQQGMMSTLEKLDELISKNKKQTINT
jgi:hypothetical protein